MKIKKEFVDLIYNGEKLWEFRNSNDKVGFYKIKDKCFELKHYSNFNEYSIRRGRKVLDDDDSIKYYFCDFRITEQEYNWIKNNMDYFTNKCGETYIVVYKWKEIEIKELEEVE